MDRRTRDVEAACLAAVFFVALAPRLYAALAWAREPVWDAHYYDFAARRIASGLGYSDDLIVAGEAVRHPWCHYPPGLSAFLGGVYALFGAGPRVAPVAMAVVGALVAAATTAVARAWLSRPRAVVAGLLVALSPELVSYGALLMTEPLASLFPLGALAAFVWLERTRPRAASVAYGLVLGVGSLVRPQTLLFAPFAALLQRGSTRVRVVAAALATVACFAAIAPWTIRNCRVMDGCTLVSSNVGWNLMIGAFPRATGRFETVRASDGCPVVTGQVQQDRCWAGVGIGHIKADPWRFLSLVPKKWGHLFDHASFPMGYLGEANREVFTEERKAAGRALLTGGHRLLVVLAAIGLIGGASLGDRRALARRAAALGLGLGLALYAQTRDETKPFWIVAAGLPVIAAVAGGQSRVSWFALYGVATLLGTHALFFGEDRYHVVVAPLLAVLAAGALRPATACTDTEALRPPSAASPSPRTESGGRDPSSTTAARAG